MKKFILFTTLLTAMFSTSIKAVEISSDDKFYCGYDNIHPIIDNEDILAAQRAIDKQKLITAEELKQKAITEQLSQDKQQYTTNVDNLNLADDKDSYKNRIANAKTSEEVLAIYQEAENAQITNQPTTTTPTELKFDSNGLLVEQASANAQLVVNDLLGPGTGYVTHTAEIDNRINALTTEEAVWVIHRIEGAGFGQTGAGMAGIDIPESHALFVEQQVNGRFGGSVHALLRAWGTFSYPGY